MRYNPYENEYRAVQSMSDGELLDYFLLRVFETEEVWGLQQRGQWFVQAAPDIRHMPLWPYKKYASEAALDIWQDCVPHALSLEYFLDHTVPWLIEQDVMLNLIPRGENLGCLISPHRLRDILVGMQDAGEYRLDG